MLSLPVLMTMDWTLTESRESARQSGIMEDCVFAEAADRIDTVGSVRCNFTNPFIETKCEFRGISFDQLQLQSYPRARALSLSLSLQEPSPGDFRQKEGKLIGGRFATDGKPFRQLSSVPSNSSLLPSRLPLVEHCLYHRFKAFRRPHLRAPSSFTARSYCVALKATLSALARPRFLPPRDVSEVTLEFIVTGGKTAYTACKRRCRFPVDWIQPSFYDCKWK